MLLGFEELKVLINIQKFIYRKLSLFYWLISFTNLVKMKYHISNRKLNEIDLSLIHNPSHNKTMIEYIVICKALIFKLIISCVTKNDEGEKKLKITACRGFDFINLT